MVSSRAAWKEVTPLFRLTHETEIDARFAFELAVATDALFAPFEGEDVSCRHVFTALMAERPTEPMLRTLLVACARMLSATTPPAPETSLAEMADALARHAMDMCWGIEEEPVLRRASLLAVSILDDGMASDEFLSEVAMDDDGPTFLVLLAQLVMGISVVLALAVEPSMPSTPLREVLRVHL